MRKKLKTHQNLLKAPCLVVFISTVWVRRHTSILCAKLAVKLSFSKTAIAKYNNKFQKCASLPLWQDNILKQMIISYVLGLSPSIHEEMCPLSSLVLNHPKQSKEGGCFQLRAVALQLPSVLFIKRWKWSCSAPRRNVKKNLLVLPLIDLAPSLEHELLSSGWQRSKVP